MGEETIQLLKKSAVKAVANANDYSFSAKSFPALEAAVLELLLKAMEKAGKEHRKTVLPRDFEVEE